MNRNRFVAASCALCALAACSLTSKSEPLTPRYFTPERVASTSAGGEQAKAGTALIASAGAPLALRLGRVSAASYLREYIAYRDSELELGFYEARRWTEQPDAYLRRALEHALFERRGLTRSLAAGTPELSVELTAFDEVRKPQHGVLCKVKVLLIEGSSARLEETIVIEERLHSAATADDAASVAEALARALDSAVQRTADRAVETLRELSAAAPRRALPLPCDRHQGSPERLPVTSMWNHLEISTYADANRRRTCRSRKAGPCRPWPRRGRCTRARRRTP